MTSVTNKTRFLLSLLQVPNFGNGSLRNFIIKNHDRINDSNVFDLFINSYPKYSINVNTLINYSDDIVDKCERDNIGLVSILDDSYPIHLKNIPDPPPLLYYKGNISILNKFISVAVVGTRKPSKYGLEVAYRVSYTLASKGFSIVSGLALGIDTSSHKGALDAKGLTVAVLAHGLDSVSPASNKELAICILDNNGLLLSEHPPLTPAFPPEFVRRNRIQSGLSRASIIVESGKEGGSIHQAKFTLKQNRVLYVVLPLTPSVANKDFNRAGADYLSAEYNAKILRSSDDLKSIYNDLILSNEKVIGSPDQLEFQW